MVHLFTRSRITASALTRGTPTSCSVYFSGFTEMMNLKARASAWRWYSASSTVTAGGCGPSPVGPGWARLSISSYHLHQRRDQVPMSRDALPQFGSAVVVRKNHARAQEILYAASVSG